MKFTATTIAFIVFSLQLYAQQNLLTGRITDDNSGLPLAGVHIRAFHQNLQTPNEHMAVSGQDGEFLLNTPEGEFMLELTMVGYMKKQLKMNYPVSDGIQLTMCLENLQLKDVRISSARIDQKVEESPFPLAVVDKVKLRKQPAIAVSDILNREPGISLFRDGIWATGVNIRGLSEQRIIYLVDGNRMETATDLAGALSTVETLNISRIEVIKGAASAMYGSGAMGGIVNIITETGRYNPNFYLDGLASTTVGSVNGLFSQFISLHAGDQKWHVRFSLHNRNAADTKTPEGILDNSRFNDNGVSGILTFKPFDKHELTFSGQKYHGWDCGIPGGAVLPRPAKATYLDFDRNLLSLEYRYKPGKGILKGFNSRLFSQDIYRQVEILPNVPPTKTGNRQTLPLRFNPAGSHATKGLLLQADFGFSPLLKMTTGLEVWKRDLKTSREKLIQMQILDSAGQVVSSSETIRGEIPVPESASQNMGLFTQAKFTTPNQKLTLSGGARIDQVRISNKKTSDPAYLIINGDRNDQPPNQLVIYESGQSTGYTWSFNFGSNYSIAQNQHLTFNIARSFRAPSLEERYKYIDLGNRVELGNPELKPENGWFIDVGLKSFGQHLQLNGNVFANRIFDLIVLAPADSVTFHYTDPDRGSASKVKALRNTNVNESLLYGFDMGMEISIADRTRMNANLTCTRGIDTKNDSSLPLIPPLNGRAGIFYNWPEFLTLGFSATWFSRQDKTAEGEMETPGYTVFDFSLISDPLHLGSIHLEILSGVENMLNKDYRYHLSSNRGLLNLEPGRNFYITVRMGW